MSFILLNRPPNILDQYFGMNPAEVLTEIGMHPQHSHSCNNRRMKLQKIPCRSPARCASHKNSGSDVSVNNDQFQVSLDVQHFTPEEINVKTIGNHIIVEAKHEEKHDDHGYISRHFVRKYSLPDGRKPEDVISKLSTDGVLTITAPRKTPPAVNRERVVPITVIDQTNTPNIDGNK